MKFPTNFHIPTLRLNLKATVKAIVLFNRTRYLLIMNPLLLSCSSSESHMEQQTCCSLLESG